MPSGLFHKQTIVSCCLLCVSACLTMAGGPVLQPLRIETQNGSSLNYKVEVADTNTLRSKGLMYRKSLPADQGMLLAYPQAKRVSVWMKNTYVSLDIIYIDGKGKIKQIESNAEPLSTRSIVSQEKILAVLELNAGETKRQAIKVGDQVYHALFN